MPTVLSHPAAALAIVTVLQRHPTLSLVGGGMVCTVLPDADVLAFFVGIPYAHPLGHRGFSHSLFFAALVGLLAMTLWHRLVDDRPSRTSLFAYFALATASNGLLDALTDGGLGVGFFLPFDSTRYFLPWRPIQVSPLSLTGLLERSRSVLVSEWWGIWLPSLLIATGGLLLSWYRAPDDGAS